MNVLFVCTDNYARSVVAQFCMQDYLRRSGRTDLSAASAGIRADSDTSAYSVAHFQRMKELGIDIGQYARTQVDQALLDRFDLIVCMGTEHQTYLRSKFNVDAVLFNEIYKGEPTSVAVDARGPQSDLAANMRALVDMLHEAMPTFVEHLAGRKEVHRSS